MSFLSITTRKTYALSEIANPTLTPPVPSSKLEGEKLSLCKSHFKKIFTNSNTIQTKANNMYIELSGIAQATEVFYQKATESAQKTFPNIDSLIIDLGSQNDTITSLQQTTQTNLKNINCDSGNPINQLVEYNKDIINLVQALTLYRQAVQQLIISVKDIVSEPTLTP
jgi:hypothetical protein